MIKSIGHLRSVSNLEGQPRAQEATGPNVLDPTALFNGYVGANLAFAYERIGLFAALKPGATITFDALASRAGTIRGRLGALLKTGIVLGYLERDLDGCYAWTDAGAELARHAAYFTWGVGGYGKFFRELGALASNTEPWSHLRDGGMVALGSDQANVSFMQDKLHKVLDGIEFTRIADLGCGNAGRLVEFCTRYPGMSGVGIDINRDAIALAKVNVANSGLASSIELHCQNVLQSVEDVTVKESLRDVEVVTCFMMLHDLFNSVELKNTLFDRLRAAFPKVKYFVIADTVRMPSREELDELPIFNIGFELVHAFMDVTIQDKSTYEDAFADAGLVVESCVEFGTPNTYLYLLRA